MKASDWSEGFDIQIFTIRVKKSGKKKSKKKKDDKQKVSA